MKFTIIIAVLALVVCGTMASRFSSLAEKLIPSFATGFVIKGQDAAPHVAPYIVSLSNKSGDLHSHICGGTIINKEWIITAAHCISNPIGMGIRAGLHQRSTVTERTQSRVVDFGKVHNQYPKKVGPYDIALLHISEPFDFNVWVQPAALPAREQLHSGVTHLYGWGQPTAFQFSGAETLQTVETAIVEHETCVAKLPADAPIARSNVCSDSYDAGISACNGDSGGPLVIEREGSPSELIGIVSWGYIPCGMAKKKPSIYTRVSAYIDWIHEVQNAYYVLY